MNQRQINVAIGVLSRRRGDGRHVLIAKRPDDAVLGGYWEFPGGKIEADESPEQCLVREFMEEVGIVVQVGEALPVIKHRYPHGWVRLHPFLCSPGADPVPRRPGGEASRWVGVGELSRYQFPPANAPLLELLRSRWVGEQLYR